MSLNRTLAKLRDDLRARAAVMVAHRQGAAHFPTAAALADLAHEQLIQTYGEAELDQWSTSELWSTAYELLHAVVLNAGFSRVRPPVDTPALEPTPEPPRAARTTPRDGTSQPHGAPAPQDGHWRQAHVRICVEALPLPEQRFLQVLLESDSAPMAQRAARWPEGDDTALLAATRQLLGRVRAAIEAREAALREEGLS
ncbi:MAG: hypothetical protein AMXMBFR64_20320 [Myxococcales bacterium]